MRKALPICRTACARATLSAFAAVIAVLVIRRSWLIPAGTWRKGPKRAGTVGVRVVLIRYQTPLLLIVALAVITICLSRLRSWSAYIFSSGILELLHSDISVSCVWASKLVNRIEDAGTQRLRWRRERTLSESPSRRMRCVNHSEFLTHR
jgi:hypothetical protein